MPTKVVRTADDLEKLNGLIARLDMPVTVSYTQGDNRTRAQNRLLYRWYADISNQLGDRTHEEARAYCKYHHGLSILCRDDEVYKEQCTRVLKPLSYEQRLEAIRVFDLPVSRNMRVKQMAEYMEAIAREFAAQGVVLTDPEIMDRQEGFA